MVPTTRPVRSHPVTPDQLRQAMLGRPLDGVRIIRQAWRVTADDSDELVLIDARGKWWVARRSSDRITIWAYVGDIEAEDGFERLVEADRQGDKAWNEATRALLEG